jgi:proteasome lid subunit RPN8/RPN11
MRLEISRSVADAICAEAALFPGREICGLLFGSARRVESLAICRNVAETPETAFEIDPAQLIAAHRAVRAGGPAICGCLHSHPGGSAEPSPRDAAAATPDGSLWLIIAGPDLQAYRAVEGGALHGRFDRVAFAIDGE